MVKQKNIVLSKGVSSINIDEPFIVSSAGDVTELTKGIRLWDEQERQKQLQERRSLLATILPQRPTYLDGRADINSGNKQASAENQLLSSNAGSRAILSGEIGGQAAISSLSNRASDSRALRSQQGLSASAEAHILGRDLPTLNLPSFDRIDADIHELKQRVDSERDGIQTVRSKMRPQR